MGRSVAEFRRLEAGVTNGAVAAAVGFDRSRDGGSRVRTNTEAGELAGEAVKEAAGAVEVGEEFFFGAEFAGVRDKRAAGAARGMFDVKHFVVEDVFDNELRDKRMIHAAIEKDLIGAGIVATELAAPRASAPTEMGARERAAEKFLVERFEHGREVEVETLRVGGRGTDAGTAHALNALASALRASVIEIGLDENFWRATTIDAREKECRGTFEDR